MTQIAQGAHVYLFPEPGQVYRVQADDVATVQVLYGAPSAVITLTAQSRTFGPYDSPAKLKVTANTAPAEYTLIRAHYAELTPEQIEGGAVGVLGSNNAGGVVEPDGDVPTLGGSVTLPAMQTALDTGTAPQKAAFQSSVLGDGPLSAATILTRRERNLASPWIQRISSALYRIGWRLDSGAWGVADLQSGAFTGAATVHTLRNIDRVIYGAATSVDDGDASITYAGAGWASAAVAGTYGGAWRRTTVAGQSATISVPQSRHIAIRTVFTSNNGFARVTVDGSSSLANALLTAAQYVAVGQLASTALVANGGTLAPDDRLIDLYSPIALPDVNVTIGTALPDTAHTVVIASTGYKRAASADIRVGLSAYVYARRETQPQAGWAFKTGITSPVDLGPASAYESATNVTIGGTAEWFGNLHGHENQTSLTVLQDGIAVTMADGQAISGDVRIVRACAASHPQAASLATTRTTYRPGSRGLSVISEINWTYTGGVVNSAYFGMLPIPGYHGAAVFVAPDGTSQTVGSTTHNGATPSAGLSVAAIAGGSVAVCHESDTEFLGDIFNGGARAFFQDRNAEPLIDKLYFAWSISGGYTTTAGTTLSAAYCYQLA